MREVLRWLAFPMFIVVPTAFAIHGVETGWASQFSANRDLSDLILYFAVVLPTLATVATIERIIPYQVRWNRAQGDLVTDTLHMTTGYVLQSVNKLFVLWLGAMASAALIPSLGGSIWPTSWPIVAQLALALVVGEFGHYWWHRLGHEVPLLWRFHAVHHSPTRLYWLNANRFHWIDINIMYVFQILPLVALGMPRDLFLVYGVFVLIFGYLQHSNIDYRIGVLNYVFSSPQLHRWHHSPKVEEGNTNYAGDLMIWDQLFGTFFYPKDRTFQADPGNGMPAFPKSFWAQQLSPFRWKRIESASAAASASTDTREDAPIAA